MFRLDDGVSFIHVVIEHDDVENPDSLQDVPAFQAFVAGIGDRCDVPPVAIGATDRRRLPLRSRESDDGAGVELLHPGREALQELVGDRRRALEQREKVAAAEDRNLEMRLGDDGRRCTARD